MTPVAAGLLCAKSLLDLAFNGGIAYGLSITHPLFVSVGTLLSTPLNVLYELAARGQVPTAAGGGGMALIISAFALILADDAFREAGAATAVVSASRREPATPMARSDAAQAASDAEAPEEQGEQGAGAKPASTQED